MIRYTRLIALPMLLAISATGPASAQQVLEEVVVTATKRAESLQDVPLSILAFDGPSMRANAVTKMADLAQNMPAVTVAQNPIGNFVFIRGIGSSTNQGIEQSVSIFHDGIFMGRHQLSRAPFMDLERVEVVRGPQSIMFGKNTIGGALAVITAKPGNEFEGNVGVMVGEYGEQEVDLVLSGPLTDTLGGRIAYRNYQHDGYLENVMNGDDEPARDDWTGRGTLQWDATDNLTVTAKYEKSEFEQDGSLVQLAVLNPLTPGAAATNALNAALVGLAGGAPESYDDERAVINDGGALVGLAIPSLAGLPGFPNLAEGSDNEMQTATLTIDWGVGDHTITALSGYADYNYRDICDCDFAALPLIQVDAAEDYEQISQEIRLTSPGGQTLDYILGLYYHKADLFYTSDESFGTALLNPAAPPPNVTRSYFLEQEQEQWAVFGSFTYSLTDLTRATLGLRYTSEDKTANRRLDKRFTDGWDFGAPLGSFGSTAAEYDRFQQITEAALGGDPLDPAIWEGALGTYEHVISNRERSEEFVSWSLSLEHDLNDEIMVYGLVSTGIKGGGFDARYLKNPGLDPDIVPGADRFEYEEEEAINYELGIKSTLLGGAMNLNATIFRTEVEDLQVSIFDGATAFLVDNAAEIVAQGIEADMNWAATENLTVGLALAILDNEFEEFTNSPCWAVEAVADPVGCLNGKDVSGEPNQFSPDFSANLKLDHYKMLTDSLELHSTLNVNYSDGYFTASDLDPVITYQDSWTKVDLRFALRPMSDRWEIAVLGKNITDEKTSGNSNDQPLVPGNGFAQLDPLRSVALQATLRF